MAADRVVYKFAINPTVSNHFLSLIVILSYFFYFLLPLPLPPSFFFLICMYVVVPHLSMIDVSNGTNVHVGL